MIESDNLAFFLCSTFMASLFLEVNVPPLIVSFEISDAETALEYSDDISESLIVRLPLFPTKTAP